MDVNAVVTLDLLAGSSVNGASLEEGSRATNGGKGEKCNVADAVCD